MAQITARSAGQQEATGARAAKMGIRGRTPNAPGDRTALSDLAEMASRSKAPRGTGMRRDGPGAQWSSHSLREWGSPAYQLAQVTLHAEAGARNKGAMQAKMRVCLLPPKVSSTIGGQP